MGLRPLEIILSVYRRQILTYKDGPRAERANGNVVGGKDPCAR